jgi:hypothetical protein
MLRFAPSRRLLALTLFALAVAGCGQHTPTPPGNPAPPNPNAAKPGGDIGSKASGQPGVGEGPPAGTVISLTAAEFYDAFNKDPAAATKRFQNAVVELTGVITNISPVPTTPPQGSITLEGPGLGNFLLCYTTDPEPWKKVSFQQKVKLRGVLPERLLHPGLTKCEFVDLTPNPTPVLTAAALAAEYVANKQQTETKYDHKILVVSGEVVKKKADENGCAQVWLKGKDPVMIDLAIPAYDPTVVDPIKPGQQLTVLGTVTGGHEENCFSLRLCHVLKKP